MTYVIKDNIGLLIIVLNISTLLRNNKGNKYTNNCQIQTGQRNQISVSIQQYIILYMQVDQKLLKKASRSAKDNKHSSQVNRIREMEDLLTIDLITLPNKKVQACRINNDSSRGSSRKSHKSLAVNLQKIQRALQAKLTIPKQQLSKTPKIAIKGKTKDKQAAKIENVLTQKHQQSTQNASYQYQYVEKKLKVGKKTKSNAMKEFILQTLNRAKAQGNCLVIHKGTAQSNYSPFNKSKGQAPKNKKQQFPLVLVQAGNVEKSKKQKKSIFGSNPKKINKNNSESKSTSINLPTINKKWVKMAREFQSKGKKQQKRPEMQVIEQRIEVMDEDRMQEIKEQIHQSMVPNQSIIKQQIISKQ